MGTSLAYEACLGDKPIVLPELVGISQQPVQILTVLATSLTCNGQRMVFLTSNSLQLWYNNRHQLDNSWHVYSTQA